jgi:hypothetical protein
MPQNQRRLIKSTQRDQISMYTTVVDLLSKGGYILPQVRYFQRKGSAAGKKRVTLTEMETLAATQSLSNIDLDAYDSSRPHYCYNHDEAKNISIGYSSRSKQM